MDLELAGPGDEEVQNGGKTGQERTLHYWLPR